MQAATGGHTIKERRLEMAGLKETQNISRALQGGRFDSSSFFFSSMPPLAMGQWRRSPSTAES